MLAMVKFRIRDYLARLDFLPRAEETVRTLTARQVVVFSFPVLIMSLLRSFSDPVINTGLAHTAAPELALAAYAVGWSVVLCVLDTSGMLHQVVLGFMDAQYRSPHVFSLLRQIVAAVRYSRRWALLPDLLGSGEALTDGAGQWRALPLVVNLREYYWGVAMLERKPADVDRKTLFRSARVLPLVLPPVTTHALASMLAEALTLLSSITD